MADILQDTSNDARQESEDEALLKWTDKAISDATNALNEAAQWTDFEEAKREGEIAVEQAVKYMEETKKRFQNLFKEWDPDLKLDTFAFGNSKDKTETVLRGNYVFQDFGAAFFLGKTANEEELLQTIKNMGFLQSNLVC